MKEYVCKIGTIHDVIRRYDNDIKEEKNNELNDKRIAYYLEKNNIIIGKMFAILDKNMCEILEDNSAYLFSFEMKEEYRNKGLFTKLYRFAEKDLKNRGITKLILSVEDNETGNNNLKIYNHYGYNTFVKSSIEIEELENKENEYITYKINYYKKDI